MFDCNPPLRLRPVLSLLRDLSPSLRRPSMTLRVWIFSTLFLGTRLVSFHMSHQMQPRTFVLYSAQKSSLVERSLYHRTNTGQRVVSRGQHIIHVGKIISHDIAVWHSGVVTVRGQRVASSPHRVMEHVRQFLSDSSRIWHNVSSCSMLPSYFCPASFFFFQFLHLCFPFTPALWLL